MARTQVCVEENISSHIREERSNRASLTLKGNVAHRDEIIPEKGSRKLMTIARATQVTTLVKSRPTNVGSGSNTLDYRPG